MSDTQKISARERDDEPTTGAAHPLLDSLDIKTGYSKNIMLRMAAVGALIIAAIFWQSDLVSDIYFRNQIEGIGALINGGILLLFAVGIVRLVILLLRYGTEENMLVRFVKNMAQPAVEPTQDIAANSIIARRYQLMRNMHEQRTLINHSALASMLLASESTHTSMVRFINNILILAGVFGTIISLSIALLGASNMLDATASAGGISQVLSGMSTALSTTITAITCYLYFGYFFLKISDVQTQIINNTEQVTAALLIPKFNLRADTVTQDIAALANKLQDLAATLEKTQELYSTSGQKLLDAVNDYSANSQRIVADINTIKGLLRSGFRLPDDDEKTT